MNFFQYIAPTLSMPLNQNFIDSSNLYKILKSKFIGKEAYHCAFDFCTNELEAFLKDKNKNVNSKYSIAGKLLTIKASQGLIYFDFDKAEAPQDALVDAKKLRKMFCFDEAYLCYSGNKGYHVAVPEEYFGTLEPSGKIHLIFREFSKRLKNELTTIDTGVYDQQRKFRALNSMHPKTKRFKKICDWNWSHQQCVKFCETIDENVTWFKTNHDVAESSIAIEIIDGLNQRIDSPKETSHDINLLPQIAKFRHKPCIKAMLDSDCEEGERNNTAYMLICEFRKVGMSESIALQKIIEWSNRQFSQKEKKLINKIVERVRQVYKNKKEWKDFSCKSYKDFCAKEQCSVWKTLSTYVKKQIEPNYIPVQSNKKREFIEWTDEFFKNNSVTAAYNGLVWLNGEFSDNIKIAEKMFIDNLRGYFNSEAHKRAQISAIKIIVDSYIEKKRKQRLDVIKNNIAFRHENKNVEYFLKAVTQKEPDITDCAILRHWMWLVKRKIFNLKVKDHIMLIFWGTTGSGKSEAVHKLLSPIRELTDEADVTLFGDERQYFRFVENFVINFDEFQHAKKLSMNGLKRIISSNWITYRLLGSNKKAQGPNNCSFIGSSNHSPMDILQDSTSARRYYGIETKEQCDWQTINEIDYLKMWQSIDENKESTYITDSKDIIKTRQEEIRYKDSVEEFVVLNDLIPHSKTFAKKLNAKELYAMYKDWMELQNLHRVMYSLTKFGREVRKYLEKKRRSDGFYYYVKYS